MAWIFERTIELAAWLALIVSWISLGLAVYWGYCWVATLQTSDPSYDYLRDSAKAAGAFVGFALALGGLACVDRFLFDTDE